MKADWLDDMVRLATPEGFDYNAAAVILETYIAQDLKEVETITKKSQENKDSGFWATLRGGTYKAELATAKSQLSYHQKVAAGLKGLPENKKERERLVSNLLAIKKNLEELEALRKEFKNAADTTQKIKLGARIAAKEVEMNATRALVKGSFLL